MGKPKVYGPKAYVEPDDAEYESKRSSLKGEPIPSIKPDKVGGWRWNDPALEDTVVLGHPEIAGVSTLGFDNESRYLDSEPERYEQNYVSAEDIRKRSKGGGW